MAKKTIRVATWEYRDKAKKRRRAYYGDVVDLPAAEVKRGEAAGVFGAFDAVADETPTAPEPALVADGPGAPALPAAPVADATGDDDLAGLGDDEGQVAAATGDDADAPAEGDVVASDADGPQLSRPRNTAPHEDWIEYAVATGLDRAEAAAMERAELIKALS